MSTFVTSSVTVAGVDRVVDALAVTLSTFSRRRLAPACPGAGHSPRPFLARGVPDPLSFPGLRSLAGRLGSSLWPSGGAHGVRHPSQVCSRPAGGRAGCLPAAERTRVSRLLVRPIGFLASFGRSLAAWIDDVVRSSSRLVRRAFDSRIVRAARGRSSRAIGCRRSRFTPSLVARDSPAAFSEHFCSSGPTCLLIDRVRAPMFFVGVIVPPVGETNRSERRPIRTFNESIRLLGFAPAVGPCRRRR
jgi:hypothetical protein